MVGVLRRPSVGKYRGFAARPRAVANRGSEPVHVPGRAVGPWRPIDSPECLCNDHLPFGIRSDTLLETFFTRKVIMSKRDDLPSYRLVHNKG